MHRKSLFWRLFSAYLMITLLSLGAVAWFASSSIQRLYHKQMSEDLEARAWIVSEWVKEQGPAINASRLDAICKDMGVDSAMRITVLLPSGKVIADSDWAPASMETHADRPEFLKATEGEMGVFTRFSRTLQMNMMYVAVPVLQDAGIIAVVRTSVSLSSIENVLHKAYAGIAVCGTIIALLATAACILISHKISNPIEELRRQFVANVSHELRTPITSIKGFIETLLDGAMDNREDAERFLRIVARQANRMNAIVDDLLALSRLEQESIISGIPLETASVNDVLQNGIEVCENKAKSKKIEIVLQCGNHLEAKINPPLLEQAVVNLIDNAIKFTPDGGTVWVEGRKEKRETVIHVRDKGQGIDSSHFPRLFERFYRVDKARSRSEGGTGLGLAIVKHIVALHRGRVYVESSLGEGSTFSIYIP